MPEGGDSKLESVPGRSSCLGGLIAGRGAAKQAKEVGGSFYEASVASSPRKCSLLDARKY